MPDQERFNGLTLEELNERLNIDAPISAHAVMDLITAYKLTLLERDVAIARLELLRKAAGGK